MPDWDTLKGQGADGAPDNPIEPPDGNHTVTLARGRVGMSRDGDELVFLEWQTLDFAYYWTTIHGTSDAGWPFTRRTLAKLEIDVEAVASWEELKTELQKRQGGIYVVNTWHNGQYLNLKILEKPEGIQTTLEANGAEPATEEEPAPAATPAASVFDDDDIPF
jgi:hypothetical protein